MQNIRRDLFNKISNLHVGYFHDQKKGDILSSISNDVTEVQNGVANSFHVLFREPLLILGFLAGLVLFSASSFQQFGIEMTGESGKAGFIKIYRGNTNLA